MTDIIGRVVDDLKDESEPYRKMVMETVEKIVANLGAADVDQRLEERMMDGMLFAFQEQTTDDSVMLNGMSSALTHSPCMCKNGLPDLKAFCLAAAGFGTIVNVLGQRTKPYLPQVCGILLWRLNNKSAKGMYACR